MKRAVFVHGWYGHPTDGWWAWLKSKLEADKFRIIAQQMPHTEEPQVDEWVRTLNGMIDNSEGDTYLIGHSLGCIAILRFLEQLSDNNRQFKAVVLVAGFTQDLTFDGYNGELSSFVQSPIDPDAIKGHCSNFWVISSDNDPTVSKDNHDRLVRLLNAKEVWEHNKKHMTGDDGIFELPSVLTAIQDTTY